MAVEPSTAAAGRHPLSPLRIVAGEAYRHRLAMWLIERLTSLTDLPGGYECIGVVRGTEIVGACLFTDYRPCEGGGSITMWASGHNWISRRVIREMFGYPFRPRPDGLGCHRITVLIARSNRASREFVAGDGRGKKGLGFREEGKIRRGHSTTSDLMIYGLLRDEQNWI